MAASAWQFLLSQPASTLSEQVRELSPEQIRNLLHALSDGLVDIASVPTSTSAASSQASAPTGPPAFLPHPGQQLPAFGGGTWTFTPASSPPAEASACAGVDPAGSQISPPAQPEVPAQKPAPQVKAMPRQHAQPGADAPLDQMWGPPPAQGYAPSPAQMPASWSNASPSTPAPPAPHPQARPQPSPKGTGKFGQTYSQPAEPAKGAGKPAGKPRGSQWLLDIGVPATEFGEHRPQFATLAASDCLHTQVYWSTSARPFYIDEHRVVKCAVQCQKPACPLGGMPCDKPFWAGARLSEDCHRTHLCSHCKAGRD